MVALMDKAIYTGLGNNSKTFLTRRKTFLEYLMRDYFQFYGFPDLWIISAPFYHEAWKWNKNEHGQNMKTFKYLISSYLPASTKLINLPDSRECMASMPR